MAELLKTILLTLMVIGACAGSTGGGLKCARVLLLFKNLRRNIHKILHPRRVQVVHVDGTPVDEKLSTAQAFISPHILFWLF